MITSPLYNICLQQMWLFESLLKSRGLSFGAGLKKLLLCLIFIGQSLAWKWFTRFFCRESVNAAITRFLSRMSHLRAFFCCRECRDYALFGVEFYTEIWQKFSEILRILAEILTKKMVGGASGWTLDVDWRGCEACRDLLVGLASTPQQSLCSFKQLWWNCWPNCFFFGLEENWFTSLPVLDKTWTSNLMLSLHFDLNWWNFSSDLH